MTNLVFTFTMTDTHAILTKEKAGLVFNVLSAAMQTVGRHRVLVCSEKDCSICKLGETLDALNKEETG